MKTRNIWIGLILMAALLAMLPMQGEVTPPVYLLQSGSLTAASASCLSTNCVAMPVVSAAGSVTIQLGPTFVGTVQFEGSVNSTNYVSVLGVPIAGGVGVSSATTTGVWQVNAVGLRSVQVRVSAYTSGTVAATLVRSPAAPLTNVVTLPSALTVTALTSSGAVSGTTGTFSGAVAGTTGTFTGAVTYPPTSGTTPSMGIWAAGYQPASLTGGTDTLGVANQQWIAPVWVPCNTTINGVAYLIGSVGATDKAIVALYNAAGTTLLANSTTGSSGTTVGTAGTTQALSFTSAYAATGPALYWITVQTNGTTAKIRTVPIGTAFTGVQAAGGAAPAATIASVPTTFTAAYAPVAVLF